MKHGMLWSLGLSLILVATVGLWGQPSTAPSVEKNDPKEPIKNVRLVKPFTELTDLTADQTAQLKEIRKRYHEEIAKLEAKEKEESMAVLTDAQKKEVTDLEAKPKEEHHHATTKPSPAAQP